MPATVRSMLESLRKYYGSIRAAEPARAFDLVLWENVAYLVDEPTRAHAFAALRKKIGTTPAALLRAGVTKIESAIREGGMRPSQRAAKIVACARLAVELAEGDLNSALSALPEKRMRILLKRFPGIGSPGADKILLLTKASDSAALDSNGLRVLGRVRIGFEAMPYARAYREAKDTLDDAGVRGAAARRAFLLLREHGRRLCRRSTPNCRACPLKRGCTYGRDR